MRPVYTVQIAPAVRKQLKPLPKPDKKRILDKIDSLGSNPRPAGYKQLQGFGNFFRVRVGDYRIIYNILDDVLVVAVVKVANRRDAYR